MNKTDVLTLIKAGIFNGLQGEKWFDSKTGVIESSSFVRAVRRKQKRKKNK